MSSIGYVVMPPAHGKSHLHLRFPWLVEADGLCPCRGTTSLNHLRTRAKESGDWSEYDREWARETLLRLAHTNHRIVVLIPAPSVGSALGGVHLHSARLTLPAWESNLRSRSYSTEKYLSLWEEVGASGTTYESNSSLQSEVVRVGMCWVEGGSVS